MKPKPSRWPAAILAFVLWGGWAMVINWPAGWARALLTAILQGSASFTLTLLMAAAVHWLVGKFSQPFAQALLPPFITVGVTGTLLYSLHTLFATPSPWQTMLPPMGVAFLYCLALSVQGSRVHHSVVAAPGPASSD